MAKQRLEQRHARELDQLRAEAAQARTQQSELQCKLADIKQVSWDRQSEFSSEFRQLQANYQALSQQFEVGKLEQDALLKAKVEAVRALKEHLRFSEDQLLQKDVLVKGLQNELSIMQGEL